MSGGGTASKDHHNTPLWLAIEAELNGDRRSAVVDNMIVAERWASHDCHHRSGGALNSHAEEEEESIHYDISSHKRVVRQLPLVEYWDFAHVGRHIIVIAMEDRLVLRTGFSGSEWSVPYGSIEQMYVDERGESLELVCSQFATCPPLSASEAFREDESYDFSARQGGSDGLLRASPHARECRTRVCINDGGGKRWRTESAWLDVREHLFIFHVAPPSGLLSSSSGLRNITSFMSPRIARRPLGTLAPIRRFRSEEETNAAGGGGDANGLPRSAWMLWARKRFACVPLCRTDTARRNATNEAAQEGNGFGGRASLPPPRPSIAQVLGYSSTTVDIKEREDEGDEALGFNWERDMQQFVRKLVLCDSEEEEAEEVERGRLLEEGVMDVQYGPTLLC